jgi:transcriptional regulator with XRE-family HTH domain
VSYKSEALIARLRQARETAGISQRALSDRSGLTQSHISHIERGTLEPGISNLIDLARALDMELVLVPRKLLPAVEGILASTSGDRMLSLEASKTALTELARGERLVTKQKALYGQSADLDRIAESLRQLRYLPLSKTDLNAVREARETLHRYQASAQSREVVKSIADNLQALRNRIIHAAPVALRPAYALEEEDDA